MKKYTIIYGQSIKTGSHWSVLVQKELVETDNLFELLRSDERFGNTYFVFDGWCSDAA